MADDVQQKTYDEQIIIVIHNFVRLWIKFEATLHDELARTQRSSKRMNSLSQTYPATNYGLFYRISSSIYGKNSLTMGELSSVLSVPLSTATRVVDWLVADGYAQRLPDPKDRRVVRVALTDSGQKLHKTIEGYTTEHVQHLLSGLTKEEQAMVFIVIQKIVSVLEEAEG